MKTNPNVRTVLFATRLSKKEARAYRAMCKAMKVNPSTKLRNMALAYAGLQGKGKP